MTTAVTQQTLIQGLSPSDNSFLANRIRDLDPGKITSFNTQSILWRIAASATFVAFTVLAVGVFAYTSLYFSLYAPIAAFCSIVGVIPTANVVKTFLDYSKTADRESEKYSLIQKKFNEVASKPIREIQTDLSRRGITWQQIPGIARGNPESLKTLLPILAYIQCLDEKLSQAQREVDELKTDAQELANKDYIENREKIYNLRNAALFVEEKALKIKILSAFANAVLRKPNYQGTLKDVGKLTDVHYHERILGNELNDRTGVTEFFKFKNNRIAPINFSDAKRLSIPELTQRFSIAI